MQCDGQSIGRRGGLSGLEIRNAQTEHSRRLRAETATARRERLQAEGWRQVNILLPPESVAALDRLTAIHGTRTEAMIEVLKDR